MVQSGIIIKTHNYLFSCIKYYKTFPQKTDIILTLTALLFNT